jgi:hypothetical protein
MRVLRTPSNGDDEIAMKDMIVATYSELIGTRKMLAALESVEWDILKAFARSMVSVHDVNLMRRVVRELIV